MNAEQRIAAALEGIEGLLSDWMKARAIGLHIFSQSFRDFRRTRKDRRAGGKHSGRQWHALKEFYDFTCLSCERREPEIQLTKDHVDPRGMNDITNIQPLCPACQDMKKDAYIDFRVSDVAARAIRRAAARRQKDNSPAASSQETRGVC
jgi:hypothetical protein